ncbi:DUF2877 domain-containing protein [Escherichia coli]|uniref:DUF2877 domain-containing protein n=1 Tax=Escherichia coli TaxID=562 RepID=UPI003D366389
MDPLNLTPVSAGYLALDRLAKTGNALLRIHSCFMHTINLQMPDNELLILSSENKRLNHPDAICVQVPAGWDWRSVDRGPITLCEGKLSSAEWEVNTRHATCWRPAIPSPFILSEPERKLDFLSEQLRLHCDKNVINSSIMLLPNNKAQQKNRPLLSVKITPKDNKKQLEKQVDDLIGFGFGLTPDGDDYLLGYLSAIFFSEDKVISQQRKSLVKIISTRLNRTNDISRHYLKRATEGHFSEAICTLLMQLPAPYKPLALAAAAETVMQFGASSGVDCLAGLLHGMRTSNSIH